MFLALAQALALTFVSCVTVMSAADILNTLLMADDHELGFAESIAHSLALGSVRCPMRCLSVQPLAVHRELSAYSIPPYAVPPFSLTVRSSASSSR